MIYTYIGKIVNTHALKGEVRILSSFDLKERVFIKDNNIYIGENKEVEIIETYRIHKNFDMVKFVGKDNINDVIKYKVKKVYVLKDSLNLKEGEYLDSDLIGLDAFFLDEHLGKIDDIINNNGYKLFYVKNKYIPYNKEFIEKIDLNDKKIIFKNVGELI